jgi:hypothetical protein
MYVIVKGEREVKEEEEEEVAYICQILRIRVKTEERSSGQLVAVDEGGWRPHVKIHN